MPGNTMLDELKQVEDILKIKIEIYKTLRENTSQYTLLNSLYKNIIKRIKLFHTEVEELRIATEFTHHLNSREIWQYYAEICELLQKENWYHE